MNGKIAEKELSKAKSLKSWINWIKNFPNDLLRLVAWKLRKRFKKQFSDHDDEQFYGLVVAV